MLAFTLLAASNPKLDEASYLLHLGKKSAVLKALGIYKSLYVKGMIDEDKRLKIEALKGLVAGSKRLGLDAKEYERELFSLTKRSKRIEVPKRLQNRLKRIVLRKGRVEFYFDFPLSSKDISFYKSHGKYHIHTYLIKARSGIGKRSYRFKTIHSMKILPRGKSKTKILFINTKPFFSSYSIRGNRLDISLQKGNLKKNPYRFKSAIPVVVKNRTRIIVVDPGHGGKDTGAIGYKRKREKDIVLAIAKKVYRKLRARGYKVYMTRKGDYFVTLRNRTKFANRMKADLFISIHANAAPKKSKYLSMKGLETFYLSPARSRRSERVAALENRAVLQDMNYYSKKVFLNFINREKTILSNKLAIDMQRGILYVVKKKFHIVDGGVRPGPFWVLVGAQMPAILIETGYITNPTEAMRLSNPYYQNLLSEGIVKGVENYFLHNEK